MHLHQQQELDLDILRIGDCLVHEVEAIAIS